jgi:hypothetical protein
VRVVLSPGTVSGSGLITLRSRFALNSSPVSLSVSTWKLGLELEVEACVAVASGAHYRAVINVAGYAAIATLDDSG